MWRISVWFPTIGPFFIGWKGCSIRLCIKYLRHFDKHRFDNYTDWLDRETRKRNRAGGKHVGFLGLRPQPPVSGPTEPMLNLTGGLDFQCLKHRNHLAMRDRFLSQNRAWCSLAEISRAVEIARLKLHETPGVKCQYDVYILYKAHFPFSLAEYWELSPFPRSGLMVRRKYDQTVPWPAVKKGCGCYLRHLKQTNWVPSTLRHSTVMRIARRPAIQLWPPDLIRTTFRITLTWRMRITTRRCGWKEWMRKGCGAR